MTDVDRDNKHTGPVGADDEPRDDDGTASADGQSEENSLPHEGGALSDDGALIEDGSLDQEVSGLLAGLPKASASESFSRSLESRLRRRSRGRFFGVGWQASSKPTYLAALTILIILAILFLFGQVGGELEDAAGRSDQELRQENDRRDDLP